MNRGTDADSNGLSIACVIHSLAGGGAERVMAGLVSRLTTRGHRVSLITFDDGMSDRYPVEASVCRRPLCLRAGASGLLGKVLQIRNRHRAIASAVREIAPDVVLSFCDRTNIDVLWSIGRGGPPVVVSERSDPAQQSLGWFWNAARRRWYRCAAAVIALTETSAAHLRPFANNVHVIASAVDSPTICSDRRQACAAKTIVGAGRLEREKGFDLLLDAFAQCTADKTDWRLILYGEGSCRGELERQAIALGIRNRVELPGWVRPLNKPLSQSTFFCLSSRYEGFPSVLLEAMSMGVPVISVDCESGPRAIIEHGRNGLLLEPSVDGLAEGITRLINNVAEREKLGKAGLSVAEQFSWDKMVARYEAVLRTVVE